MAVSSEAHRLKYVSIMRIYYVRHRVFETITTFGILCFRGYEMTPIANRPQECK